MYIRELPTQSLTALKTEAKDLDPKVVEANLSEITFNMDTDPRDPTAEKSIEVGDEKFVLDDEGIKALGTFLEVPAKFLVRLPGEEQQYIIGKQIERQGGVVNVRTVPTYDVPESDEVKREGAKRVLDFRDPGQRTVSPWRYIDLAQRIVGEEAIVLDYINDPWRFRLDVAVRHTADYAIGGDPKVNDLAGGGLTIEQDRKRNLAPVIASHVFRYVCTNGMVFTDPSLKIDMRGTAADDLLFEMERKAELAFSRVERLVEEFYDMRNEQVANVHARLLEVGQEMGIPNRTIMQLQERIPAEINHGSGTMFDVVNLITNAANNPSLRNRPDSQRSFQVAGAHMVGEHTDRCINCQKVL